MSPGLTSQSIGTLTIVASMQTLPVIGHLFPLIITLKLFPEHAQGNPSTNPIAIVANFVFSCATNLLP